MKLQHQHQGQEAPNSSSNRLVLAPLKFGAWCFLELGAWSLELSEWLTSINFSASSSEGRMRPPTSTSAKGSRQDAAAWRCHAIREEVHSRDEAAASERNLRAAEMDMFEERGDLDFAYEMDEQSRFAAISEAGEWIWRRLSVDPTKSRTWISSVARRW